MVRIESIPRRGRRTYEGRMGTWTFKQLRSSSSLQRSGLRNYLNLNGVLYVWKIRLDDDETRPCSPCSS
ncbi:unnamed protein product [Brassica rapa subsp. trilocularis]